MKKILFLGILCITNINSFSQEREDTPESNNKSKHQIGLLLGHVHIPSAIINGKKEWRIYPSTSFYYNYWLNNKWALGLHTDIIIEDFLVEKNLSAKNQEQVIERERPLAPALMAVFKPKRHISFSLGFGSEFTKGENLFLLRAEISYAIEIIKEWEFEIALGNDLRFNAYNTINLGVGVSKSFF